MAIATEETVRTVGLPPPHVDLNLGTSTGVPAYQDWPIIRSDGVSSTFRHLRTGVKGHIRENAELRADDVAMVLNDQLMQIPSGMVSQILNRFSIEQREDARIVLGKISRFGSLEGLGTFIDTLRPHFEAGKKLYVTGGSSLADNLSYLNNEKSSFDTAEIPTTKRIDADSIVVLDDLMIHKLQCDEEFRMSVINNRVPLIVPEGFINGINMFNAPSPDAIYAKTEGVFLRALAMRDEHIERAVGTILQQDIVSMLPLETAHLVQNVSLDFTTSDPYSTVSIARQMNGNAGITAEQIQGILTRRLGSDSSTATFQGISLEQVAFELLIQNTQVVSARRYSHLASRLMTNLVKIAAKHDVSKADIVYVVPDEGRSYGLMTMAFRLVNDLPPEQFVASIEELKARKPHSNSMVVVVDDMCGSGENLKDVYLDVRSVSDCHLALCPLITTRAGYMSRTRHSPFQNPSFREMQKVGVTDKHTQRVWPLVPDTRLHFLPSLGMPELACSLFFKNLSEAQKNAVWVLLQGEEYAGYSNFLGHDANASQTVMFTMAPDNNNYFFNKYVAHHFTLNGKGVKSCSV